MRLQCVDALLKCYSEIAAWRGDGTSSLAIARHSTRHLLLYSELSKHDRSVPWLLYPKYHEFAHCSSHLAVNPALEWNYTDESTIGVAAQFTAQCSIHYVPTVVMEKHADLFGLDL